MNQMNGVKYLFLKLYQLMNQRILKKQTKSVNAFFLD